MSVAIDDRKKTFGFQGYILTVGKIKEAAKTRNLRIAQYNDRSVQVLGFIRLHRAGLMSLDLICNQPDFFIGPQFGLERDQPVKT